MKTPYRTCNAYIAALLLALTLLGVGPATSAAPFDDVPSGHWAYAVLEQLSAVELIDGYPPGFFSGSRRLTRYEMALSLAGALQRLTYWADGEEAGDDRAFLGDLVAAYNAKARRPLSAGDAEMLARAVGEFTPELEMLGYKPPSPEGAASAQGERRRLLDSSLGPVIGDMLYNVGAARDRWSLGPPAADLRPASRLGPSARVPVDVGPPLSAWQGGTTIARLGSTLFFLEPTPDGTDPEGVGGRRTRGLDGTIHLTGPPVAPPLQPDAQSLGLWQVTETRADMREVSLATNVSLSGERTQRASAAGDVVDTQVKATVLLGDFSIDGKLRTVAPDLGSRLLGPDDGEAGSGEDLLGLGLTLRLGDVFLTTGQDLIQRTDDPEQEIVRSLILEYSFTDAATVTAGWQSVSDARERASVGVNVPVPLGALHFALAYEGARQAEEGVAISMTTLTMAGLDLKLWDQAEARAAVSVRGDGLGKERATSLGLRYSLNPEAAVLFGYKFIDFAEPEPTSRNVTTAEFSIRF